MSDDPLLSLSSEEEHERLSEEMPEAVDPESPEEEPDYLDEDAMPEPETRHQVSGVAHGPNDNTAIIVLGTILIVIVGVLVYAFINLGPPMQEWLDSKLNATPQPQECIDIGEGDVAYNAESVMALCEEMEYVVENYEARPIEEICGGYCESVAPETLVCPGCQPCPVTPGMEITDDREVINAYLAEADEALIHMEASIALMEELAVVMRSFGDYAGNQANAFTDTQWLQLLDDMDRKVERVRSVLDNTWPPGPHNNCNPMMDAHARLLLAFANLDEGRDDIMKAYHARNTDSIAYRYMNHTEDARGNMTHARSQLAHVR